VRILQRVEHQLGLLLHEDPVRLERLVGRLREGVLGADGVARLREYEAWLNGWLRWSRTERGHRLIRLWGDLRAKRSYRGYFQTFEKTLQRRGLAPDDLRVVLAEWRAVEPLLDAEDSGGVEQSWQDLDSAGSLARYLNAALAREAVLLERESSSDRARGVSRRA
jgi:hypothetical protein